MKRTIPVGVAILLLFSLSVQSQSFTFNPGDFYAIQVHSNTITQYDGTGAPRASLTVALPPNSYELRGLAFGPDGYLYATVAKSGGFNVLTLDSDGIVQQTYTHSAYITGDIGYGKISFDSSGRFYVAAGIGGLVRFDIANPSGFETVSTAYGVQDVEVLPSGNILMATNYDLYELTPQGQTVRKILPSDPNHLVSGTTPYFTDIKGIEYDPITNSIYVNMLGHSGFYNKLMRLDGDTGILLGYTTFQSGCDMFLSWDRRLVAGSYATAPRFFSTDLAALGAFSADPSPFVTQYPIPEPSSSMVLFVGMSSILHLAVRWRKNRSRI